MVGTTKQLLADTADVSMRLERLTELAQIREPGSDTLLDVHPAREPRGHSAAGERIGSVDTDGRRSDESQLLGVLLAGDHACPDRHPLQADIVHGAPDERHRTTFVRTVRYDQYLDVHAGH